MARCFGIMWLQHHYEHCWVSKSVHCCTRDHGTWKPQRRHGIAIVLPRQNYARAMASDDVKTAAAAAAAAECAVYVPYNITGDL